MTEPDEHLYRRWGHSFEEDHDGIVVYRPWHYAFPPARGRAGIEVRPDGTWVEWAVGRGDAPEARQGRWAATGASRLRVLPARGDERVLEVVHVGADRLELRRSGA